MIEVGSVIGALPTVGLLVLTSGAGLFPGAQRGDQDPVQRPAEDAAGEMPGREVMGA